MAKTDSGSVKPLFDRRSIREKVHEHLRQSILEGIIQPGEKLVETHIAAQMGVSRTPVREALPILENEGLVEAVWNGFRVTPVSWKDVEEICALRIANESLAALWALDRITPAELEEMEQYCLATEAEVRRGELDSFVKRDAGFHELLYKAAGSERIFKICEMLRDHMARFRVKYFLNLRTAQIAVRGHRAILENFKAGDRQGLRGAIEVHIELAKDIIRECAFSDGDESEAEPG